MIQENRPVLLLEDQALITLYIEELLRQAGFNCVKTFSSCVAAAKWLEQGSPIFAIIETRLRDGACDGVAATLTRRGIPFIVHSVERDDVSVHPDMRFRHRWIEKPCRPEDLLLAVSECSMR